MHGTRCSRRCSTTTGRAERRRPLTNDIHRNIPRLRLRCAAPIQPTRNRFTQGARSERYRNPGPRVRRRTAHHVEGGAAPAAHPRRDVPDRVHRPAERRLRETADGAQPRDDGGRVRARVVAVLHRLPAVRGAEHARAASLRRTRMARADHADVGPHHRADGLHDVDARILHAALPARHRRGRFLSGRDLLPDAVVSAKLPREGARHLHARQRAREHARLAGRRRAAEPERRMGAGGLAVGVHCNRHPGRDRRDRRVPRAARVVSRGTVPRRAREADRRGRAGAREARAGRARPAVEGAARSARDAVRGDLHADVDVAVRRHVLAADAREIVRRVEQHERLPEHAAVGARGAAAGVAAGEAAPREEHPAHDCDRRGARRARLPAEPRAAVDAAALHRARARRRMHPAAVSVLLVDAAALFHRCAGGGERRGDQLDRQPRRLLQPEPDAVRGQGDGHRVRADDRADRVPRAARDRRAGRVDAVGAGDGGGAGVTRMDAWLPQPVHAPGACRCATVRSIGTRGECNEFCDEARVPDRSAIA
ncbi:hypothetical protein EMIT0111MI5_11242 [Burkholderia sp. IT-111MI5]